MKARFITLEGGEGVGKSTQVRALASALRAKGINVVETREPGGSDGAEAIRRLLMEGSDDRWDSRSEALLFAAARAEHVARVIKPALKRGDWIICDRFVDSSRAYQGGGGGIDDAAIMQLHNFGSQGLLPDRTFLLTIEPAQAAARLLARDGGNADRMGSKPDSYKAKLEQKFIELATMEPARWRIVDAGASARSVTDALLAHMVDWL